MSYAGPGVTVHCKDPYLLKWALRLKNTPQTNAHTLKVEKRRLPLKREDIYALAHKDVPNREAFDRLNQGDKTTVTYTHRPSAHKTAVNAVNADATMNPSTAEPTDTSANAVGHPKPPAQKTADPWSTPPPSNQPVCVPCSNWKKRKQTDMDYRIDWGVTNGTPWVCKPNSLCNDSHWAVVRNNNWAVKGGKPKGGKPKGGGGDKGGGGGKGGGGDKGGKGTPYGRGRW